MRRSLLVAMFVLASSVAFAQTELRVNLSSLGLGAIYRLLPVELDGHLGSEYLAKVYNPFGTTWVVIYPGRCNNAGEVEFGQADSLVDRDGDGKQEIMRFDSQTQEVTFLSFPVCR